MGAPIVRSNYFVTPKTGGRRLLGFARLLRKRKAKTPTAQLEDADQLLAEGIEALRAGRKIRHLELHPTWTPAEDGDLDGFVDGLWVAVVERLEHCSNFTRPAVARLEQLGGEPAFDYAGARKRAAAAEKIHRRLFGDSRLEFTKFKYVDQSVHMDTLWEIIEDEGYKDSLIELCGKDIYGALAHSHAHYVEMTEQRELRQQGSKVNLTLLQADLQHRIQVFLIATLAMLKDTDPASVENIRYALRPVDALRERLAQERGREGGASEAAVEKAEIDELLAEEQAIDEEEAELEKLADAEG